jgi:hypothetical protein
VVTLDVRSRTPFSKPLFFLGKWRARRESNSRPSGS